MAAFYLDNDVPIAASSALQARGHSAVTTRDRFLYRAPDYQQILTSTREGRILVTHNKTDFRLLHGAWQLWSEEWGVKKNHGGILSIPQVPAAQVATIIHELVTRHSEPLTNPMWEWHNGVWVPPP